MTSRRSLRNRSRTSRCHVVQLCIAMRSQRPDGSEDTLRETSMTVLAAVVRGDLFASPSCPGRVPPVRFAFSAILASVSETSIAVFMKRRNPRRPPVLVRMIVLPTHRPLPTPLQCFLFHAYREMKSGHEGISDRHLVFDRGGPRRLHDDAAPPVFEDLDPELEARTCADTAMPFDASTAGLDAERALRLDHPGASR
jgi:hypothetical protein